MAITKCLSWPEIFVANTAIHMKRTKLNFVIDVVAFVGFVGLTTTGVLMRYILPPPAVVTTQ